MSHILFLKSLSHSQLGELIPAYSSINDAINAGGGGTAKLMAFHLMERANVASRLDYSLLGVCRDYNQSIKLGYSEKEVINEPKYLYSCTSGKEYKYIRDQFSDYLCEERRQGGDEQLLITSVTDSFKERLGISSKLSNQIVARIFHDGVKKQCPKLFSLRPPRIN